MRCANICCAFIVVMLSLFASTARGQARIEVVGPTAQIPRDSYKTWSLFLICTPDWVSPEKSADLSNLYRRFKAFGDAIGNDNLAVWFWTQQATINDPKLADYIDVARSAEFCRELKLRPTDGPFLIVTSAYPDLQSFPRDRTVYQLGGLPSVQLAQLLNSLTDQLLIEGRVDAARRSSGAPTSVSSLWLRLLESTQRGLVGFGCAVTVKIDTGPLTAELRGCPQGT